MTQQLLTQQPNTRTYRSGECFLKKNGNLRRCAWLQTRKRSVLYNKCANGTFVNVEKESLPNYQNNEKAKQISWGGSPYGNSCHKGR